MKLISSPRFGCSKMDSLLAAIERLGKVDIRLVGGRTSQYRQEGAIKLLRAGLIKEEAGFYILVKNS